MSYARWSPESDVYVYADMQNRIHCCECRLDARDASWVCRGAGEMLRHLNEHVTAGHKVPPEALERLRGEQMRAAEQRMLASMRSALATYDGADPAQRHPETCTCSLCAFVQSCRDLVEQLEAS